MFKSSVAKRTNGIPEMIRFILKIVETVDIRENQRKFEE